MELAAEIGVSLRILAGLATFASAANAHAQSGDTIDTYVHGEVAHASRFDEVTEQMNLAVRYGMPFLDDARIGPAIVAGWERHRDSDGTADRFANHYVGPALRLTRGWFTAQAEVRSVAYVGEQIPGGEHRPAIDGRLRLNRWRRTDIPVKKLPLVVLTDSYLDAEWRPNRDNDLVLTAFDRIGIRHPLTEVVKLDLYAEPFIALDARKSYEHNKLEWRSTGRIFFDLAPTLPPIELSFAHVHNYDLPRGDFEGNTNKRSQWSRRAALVVEGEF